MPVPDFLATLAGQWNGPSQLYMPWLPEDEQISTSQSQLGFWVDANSCYCRLDYDWGPADDRHHGTMLVSFGADGDASMGWVDNWHQSTSVMKLLGKVGDNFVSVSGAYSVPGHPDWGWRIELKAKAEQEFELWMYNLTPEGEETWAVQAEYQRF